MFLFITSSLVTLDSTFVPVLFCDTLCLFKKAKMSKKSVKETINPDIKRIFKFLGSARYRALDDCLTIQFNNKNTFFLITFREKDLIGFLCYYYKTLNVTACCCFP